MVLGVGTGGVMHGDAAWRAVGLPYTERIPQTYAALAVLPDLVAGRPAVVNGEKVTLAPGAAMPPVLIGGGLPAMRRAARHGYGWYPAFLPPANLAAAIRELTDRTGRKPQVTVQVAMALGDLSSAQVDAQVQMLTGYGMTEEHTRQGMLLGGQEQAAEHIAALFAAGANRVVGLPMGGNNHHQAELLAAATRQATT